MTQASRCHLSPTEQRGQILTKDKVTGHRRTQREALRRGAIDVHAAHHFVLYATGPVERIALSTEGLDRRRPAAPTHERFPVARGVLGDCRHGPRLVRARAYQIPIRLLGGKVRGSRNALILAERVGFEPTWGGYAPNRFRVGAVMTASVPLRRPELLNRRSLPGPIPCAEPHRRFAAAKVPAVLRARAPWPLRCRAGGA